MVAGLVLLMAVALANRLWYIIELPYTADELFSMEHFIAPGLATILSDYSSPSNHVLNSVLSAIMLKLPLPEALAFRLTALLAMLASALVLFRLVLAAQSARFAFFAAGVWMASLSALYFGSVSRGHALVALFALTSFYAYRKVMDDAAPTVRWSAVFIVSSGLGFLAVPTFLLPFLALMLSMVVTYLMHREQMKLQINLLNSALGAALGVLLYVPILLNNKITALTDNWLIREYDLGNYTLLGIADHLRETLTYFDPLVAALFIPMAIIAIWLQKDWKGGFMSQALLMVAVSFAYVGFSGKLPPSRVLTFLTPFVIMAVAEGLHNAFIQVSQIYRKGLMVLIALLPVLVLVNSNKAMYRTAIPSTVISAGQLEVQDAIRTETETPETAGTEGK